MTEIEAGLYKMFREKGMTVHDLTPDQVSDWRACSAGSSRTTFTTMPIWLGS